jgi:hypothetical protein
MTKELERNILRFSLANLGHALLESPMRGPYPRIGKMGEEKRVYYIGSEENMLLEQEEREVPPPKSLVIVYTQGIK